MEKAADLPILRPMTIYLSVSMTSVMQDQALHNTPDQIIAVAILKTDGEVCDSPAS